MRTAARFGLLAVSIAITACSKPETVPPPPPPECGNGFVEAAETCEGNPLPEGCNATTCTPEDGWMCDEPPAGSGDESGGGETGAPMWTSTCERIDTCADGVVDPGEQCDDGNMDGNDGCTMCMVDPEYACFPDEEDGSSVCRTCGDGWVDTNLLGEECDPGEDLGNQVWGCPECVILDGWACEGQPSLCGPICGDGIWIDRSLPGVTIGIGEECDDGNLQDGDGCNEDCDVEPDCECIGEPPATSQCTCGSGTTTTGDTDTDTDTDSGTGTGSDTDTDGTGTGTGTGSDTTTG